MNNNKERIIQFATQRYEKLIELSQKVTTDYNEARRLDISQLRSLIIQLSVLSFGALGFSIPVIGNTGIVKTQALFISGLIVLAISSVAGLWYLAILFENSIIGALKGWRQNKKEVKEALKNEEYLLKHPDRLNEYLEKQAELKKKLEAIPEIEIKRDKFLYLLLFLFTLGVILVVASIFQISVTI